MRYPIVRQLLGASIGAAVAASCYGLYSGASYLLGADVIQTIMAAASLDPDGETLVARIVSPLPLPELDSPLLSNRAVASPPPPARFVATTVPSPEPAPESEPITLGQLRAALDASQPEPLPVPKPAPAPAPVAPAPPTAMPKSTALPSSGPAIWLLASSTLGAAAGFRSRRLAALFA